ncbi:hypothetical protein AAG570_009888 [Ranatra chinensis]|uniref:TGF-beta-activated kinase 1 and MAP3K7-binding protein 1 n=1 Tax=Ranatra chinensis TaxID=642074 RepID=A0ABD0YQE5_9HEMI
MSFQSTHSWTDDLPLCSFSGVGYATNKIYLEGMHRQEEHVYEDNYFRCNKDNVCLYMVFDGHEGIDATSFAYSGLAAELLLDQLNGKNTDEEIKEVLRQAFLAVENSYLASLDDKVAERTGLQYEIPEELTPYEVFQKYPRVVQKLRALNSELSCGTAVVLALVLGERLFVANVGNSRALLCRTDENGVLRVIQLSVDHDLSNEDEILRLYNLGLRIEKSHGFRLGNQENTRCLGNYLVKGGYKEFEELACATEEPVIAEPEIHGGIQIDESCMFLLLMSSGLYKSLEEVKETEQVNKEIAQMVVSEFRVQTTLTGVAQAVVDKIVRLHHDKFMSPGGGTKSSKRPDITLLVRNFNHQMPNAAGSQFTSSPVTLSPNSQGTLHISFVYIYSEECWLNHFLTDD